MFIQVVKSKIHRVTVTGANLDYIGSITIDQDLLEAAGIVEGERVFIVDNNNGERLDTYHAPQAHLTLDSFHVSLITFHAPQAHLTLDSFHVSHITFHAPQAHLTLNI